MMEEDAAKKLLVVYNAESDLFNKTMDWVHKMYQPETYACDLCKLTHGNFTFQKQWKSFVDSLNMKVEYLKKDSFKQKFPDMDFDFPFVAVQQNNDVNLLLSNQQIKQITSLEILINEIQKKLSKDV